MPAPGDQHKNMSQNPFADGAVERVAEFTDEEKANIRATLGRQLGPEYLSTRTGNGGGKVAYLEAHKVINLANEVFGFNGWSTSIRQTQVDFVDENSQGKISLGLHTIMRVTLKDGTYHEDIGYGQIENCRGKAAAFEKAHKEAATDALKRALRAFGNALGNCLYDKEYLKKVGHVKTTPIKFDPSKLHRHPDFVQPIKQDLQDPQKSQPESNDVVRLNSEHSSISAADCEDEYGANLFDGVELNVVQDEASMVGVSTVADTPVANITDPPPKALPSAPERGHQQPAIQPNRPGAGNNTNQQQQSVPRVQSMPSMRPPNAQAPGQPQGQQGQQGQPGQHTAQGQQPYGTGRQPQVQQGQGPPPQVQESYGTGRQAQGQSGQGLHPQNGRPSLPPQNQNRGPQTPQPGGRPDFNRGPNLPPSNGPQGQPRPQPQQLQNQNPAQQNNPQRAPAPQGGYPNQQPQNMNQGRATPPQGVPPNQPNQPQMRSEGPRTGPGSGPPNGNSLPGVPPGGVGFVTGRVAEDLQKAETSNGGLPPRLQPFNPHAESPVPKAQRTPGIDHTRSGKVTREEVAAARPGQPAQPGQRPPPNGGQFSRPNFVNPQQDVNRRIGMPMGAQSPLANRTSAYKPPTMASGIKRPALADVSNRMAEGVTTEGPDAKKVKMDGPENVPKENVPGRANA